MSEGSWKKEEVFCHALRMDFGSCHSLVRVCETKLWACVKSSFRVLRS